MRVRRFSLPWRRILLWGGVATGLVGPLAVAVVALSTRDGRDPPLVLSGGVPAEVTELDRAAPPAANPAGGGRPQDAYAGWAARIEASTGIPSRALTAYARAEVLLAGERPECRLNWATLAGIGRVESDHGRFQGRTLRPDGTPDRPIVGVPLDGSASVAAIPDTDGAKLDGDPSWDRAVGPMQFIPGTWRRFGADGDADGTADPQDVDDAAVAAARYLCAAGGDLSSAPGWWRAVLAFNSSTRYAQDVLNGANRYAAQSRG